MRYPRGTLIRNTTAARINHWITGGCFVLLLLSGLAMFHPLLYWLSALFGGGQWTRAVHPWIGCVLLVSYAGLIVQFWRDNLWNRDDIAWLRAFRRVLERGGGCFRTRPLQCRPGIRLLVDGTPGADPVRHRHRDLGCVFLALHHNRAAANCRAGALPHSGRGNHARRPNHWR